MRYRLIVELMRALARNGDPATSHEAADELLIHALRHLGDCAQQPIDELVEAYHAIPKWHE